MAENNQQNLIGVNILYQGLNMDETPLAMPQGDYSYALNLAMQNLQGSASQATNYPGNYICATLPAGYMIIGSQKIDTGYIIFSCKLDGSSQIALLENCVYTILVNDPCLGFTITHQIQSTYKETYNCGRRIYWTDNNEPRRWLDIDYISYTNSTTKTIDCDRLLLQPIIDYPCVYYYDVQESGVLLSGMYKPFIQYADINGVGYTEWFESIGFIPIIHDQLNINFADIQGTHPSTPSTTKSIKFYLSNLDTSYTHINIGILENHNGVLTAKQITTIPTSSLEYLFSGTETFIDLTLDELLAQKTIYTKAKTVCQSNGYLLWGNLSGRKDPNFQPRANEIQVGWQVFKAPSINTGTDFKSPYFTTFKKGFLRDEVYPIGIRLIYKDGTKSCTYHIPGRKLNKDQEGATIVDLIDQYGQAINPSYEWDTTPTAGADAIDGVGLARWKNYNTGMQTGYSPDYVDPNVDPQRAWNGSCAEKGFMSYWESGVSYPTTTDENGVLIYPNTAGVMDKIRHHKMPDCSIIPLFDNNPGTEAETGWVYLNHLGINIENIIFPSVGDADYDDYRDVVKWEIVVGDRTGHKSIIAKGVLYNTWRLDFSNPGDYNGGSGNKRDPDDVWHFLATDTEYTNVQFNVQTGMFNDLNKIGYKWMEGDDNSNDRSHFSPVLNNHTLNNYIFTFFSPDTSFKQINLTSQELKLESEFDGNWQMLQAQNSATFAGDTYLGSYYRSQKVIYGNVRRSLDGITYNNTNSIVQSNFTPYPTLSNTKNEGCVWLQVNANILPCQVDDFSLTNNIGPGTPDNPANCYFLMPVTTNTPVDGNGPEKICEGFDGNANLINPYRTGEISSYYGALKLSQPNQYDQLDTVTYLSVGMCPIDTNTTYARCLFGGDTFLSNYTYHRSRRYEIPLPVWSGATNYLKYQFNPVAGSCNADDYPISGVAINNTWVESNINTEYRHQGDSVASWDRFFPYGNTKCGTGYGNSLNTAKWAYDILDIAGTTINDNYCFIALEYNSLNQGKFVCLQSIENRTSCQPHYSTRVAYSERSQEESKEDYWLSYKANNFYDFPKKSGELWDMRELGQDKVLFRFENGIYAYTAYDTLETDANTIQIGTGGIFAQDPRELITTDLGYGGTRSQWAANSTEFGHFFLDDKRGNVFNLKDSINPISNVKMINFFSKNLSLKLLETFPNFANFDNPANPEGIGFNSVFDDKFKIWLLSKKDYTPVLDSSGLPLVSYQKGKFYKIGARLEEVFLNDPTYFCNKSFTIGYSPKTNRWISFYSFIPMNYISENQGFMSSVHDKLTDITKIWKHHSDKFCSYYGTGYEHIIEFPVKLQGEVTNKTSIQFITDAYDNNGYEFQNETFKKAIVYNNEEITGVLNLRVPNNNNLSTVLNLPQINLTDIDVSLENANRMIYKFNYLWNHSADRRINNPFFYSSCTPSIDKDINLSSVNYQKNWFELARISGQWAKCRLFYDNTDINLVTTLVLSKNTTDYF